MLLKNYSMDNITQSLYRKYCAVPEGWEQYASIPIHDNKSSVSKVGVQPVAQLSGGEDSKSGQRPVKEATVCKPDARAECDLGDQGKWTNTVMPLPVPGYS